MSALQLDLKDHVSIFTEPSTHSGVPLPAVPAPVWDGPGVPVLRTTCLPWPDSGISYSMKPSQELNSLAPNTWDFTAFNLTVPPYPSGDVASHRCVPSPWLKVFMNLVFR